MSSGEDFSFGMEPSEETLEGIQAIIANYKIKCDKLVQQQKELTNSIKDNREMTQKFKQRTVQLEQKLQEQQQSYQEQMTSEMQRHTLLCQEEYNLVKEIEQVEVAIREEEASNEDLRQQTDVFSAVPKKDVVFMGKTKETGDVQSFEMTSRITYPMQEGTALITFEEEEVANRILSMKKHRVGLYEQCFITVEVQPVQLMLPRLVEIHSEVCPKCILISDLPKMEIDTLLNKLEIHFHRSKNGGGEVEDVEFLPDSGTVVLKFLETNIAKGLAEREFHEVQFLQKKHTVRVTPFLNGKITHLQTKMMVCPRTVLLTGIPQVEQENLQDLLEIHFQRRSSGGGEVEAILYNPLGQHTTALFESTGPQKEQE